MQYPQRPEEDARLPGTGVKIQIDGCELNLQRDLLSLTVTGTVPSSSKGLETKSVNPAALSQYVLGPRAAEDTWDTNFPAVPN